jgi:hypothetical protein
VYPIGPSLALIDRRTRPLQGQHFHRRLWRSIKYAEVHLKAYADGCEARSGISPWMNWKRSSPFWQSAKDLLLGVINILESTGQQNVDQVFLHRGGRVDSRVDTSEGVHQRHPVDSSPPSPTQRQEDGAPAIGGVQSETGCFPRAPGFLRCRTGLIFLQGGQASLARQVTRSGTDLQGNGE